VPGRAESLCDAPPLVGAAAPPAEAKWQLQKKDFGRVTRLTTQMATSKVYLTAQVAASLAKAAAKPKAKSHSRAKGKAKQKAKARQLEFLF
jgi:hypothetical protein